MHWILALTFATQVAVATDTPLSATWPAPPAYASRTTLADPADSLLRAASERMSRGDYRGAAELYRSAVRRFPASTRLSEAMYYEAFALYRAGDLSKARGALDTLRDRYPQAAARGDANALRARICGELARQGDSACAEEVASVSASAAARSTPRAAADCPDGDDDDDSRIAALNALMQMDATRAMPILTNVLARRDKCSERLRRKAVFLVAQKQTAEAADILLAAAKNDPDAEVREQAVFWLSQVHDPRAVDMLVQILNSNGERALREKALFALSQQSNPKAVAVLRDFAEDEKQPSDLRERAIFSLGQRRGGEETEYLRTLYRKLTDANLKEKVLFALTQTRGRGNDTFILGVANDPKEPLELRKKAIFNLGQTGIDIAQLGSLYSSLDDRDLREQVIFAIAQRHEAGAIDKLMDIARADPDREMRKKAIFWLGQSRDPRATQFLAELIAK
jgi:HEAT repeat protein